MRGLLLACFVTEYIEARVTTDHLEFMKLKSQGIRPAFPDIERQIRLDLPFTIRLKMLKKQLEINSKWCNFRGGPNSSRSEARECSTS